MSLKIFITGTDTDVGKTFFTINLLKILNSRGLKTIALKPLASGGQWVNQNLYNEDAVQLLYHCSEKLHYSKINPFVYEPAIAPHIAASLVNQVLSKELLLRGSQEVLEYPCDVCLIEGAGGWHVPLNEYETMGDFVSLIECQVIIVVGMRLGCLNHSLLTYHAINAMKIPILGWVANCLDPHMSNCQENINTLKQIMKIPLLGILPFNC